MNMNAIVFGAVAVAGFIVAAVNYKTLMYNKYLQERYGTIGDDSLSDLMDHYLRMADKVGSKTKLGKEYTKQSNEYRDEIIRRMKNQ